MSVGRICVREVDVISPDESAQAAAQRMNSRKVGTLVVVDSRGLPIGIVTDRDLTVRVLAAGKDGATTPISEVFRGPLKTVHEDTSVEETIRAMRAGPYRRLPVVGDRGELVGLVSLDDVLELVSEELASIGWLLEDEEPTVLGRSS
ncbi:CBS domain-containing protein [Blastopirellula sp. JC732]|uniref:CBS domain-containing protein n=1 Tax=Blastopirellula sediminis TaxID=2894196 RepID=A0A9X1SJG6_9BACT|nr:CBS domain-containing protein [Blastopirellula sediminis]MCC9608334.1 CBS domain-containing protein [Blastopirellula sediminis]MCC9628889.1 CBS domain-containing protein [Blastopirellula sediminis]